MVNLMDGIKQIKLIYMSVSYKYGWFKGWRQTNIVNLTWDPKYFNPKSSLEEEDFLFNAMIMWNWQYNS